MAVAKLRRGKKQRTRRKTVQLSNLLAGALDELAAREALPVAAVVRRAVIAFVAEAKAGRLPAVDLRGTEDNVRSGRRGPATQWPMSVSYVLDADIADDVAQLATERGETETETVRAAVALALTRPARRQSPMTALDYGFVTKAPPTGAASAEREVLQVARELRKDP